MKSRFAGDSTWSFASAGTCAIKGSPASRHALEALKEKGIVLDSHRSQPLTEDLIMSSTFVVGMTRDHCDNVVNKAPGVGGKCFTLKELCPDAEDGDIDDPVGMPLDTYRTIRDEIDAHLDCLVNLMGEFDTK